VKKRGKANWRAGRIVLLVVIVGAAIFAVQGGEYGTSDLFRQKARHKRLVAQIDSLQRDVDSLRRVKKAIQTDPATQERIAREEFGMVRGDKEILYRFGEASGGEERR
jgi:cell division protein FtsB